MRPDSAAVAGAFLINVVGYIWFVVCLQLAGRAGQDEHEDYGERLFPTARLVGTLFPGLWIGLTAQRPLTLALLYILTFFSLTSAGFVLKHGFRPLLSSYGSHTAYSVSLVVAGVLAGYILGRLATL